MATRLHWGAEAQAGRDASGGGELFPSPEIIERLTSATHSDIDICHRWVTAVYRASVDLLRPFVVAEVITVPGSPVVARKGEDYGAWLLRFQAGIMPWLEQLRTARVKLEAEEILTLRECCEKFGECDKHDIWRIGNVNLSSAQRNLKRYGLKGKEVGGSGKRGDPRQFRLSDLMARFPQNAQNRRP